MLRKFFSHHIESHWNAPLVLYSLFLAPLSWIYYFLIETRYFFYKKGILKSLKHEVPIMVIGNIHVGGVGKTPIVCYLAEQFKKKKIKIGIISRGYGRQSSETLLVTPEGHAEDFGDEPLLIANKTKAPVVVAKKRNDAIKLLLQLYPETNLILSDDGLQHYALKRDIELIVFPSKSLGTTEKLLPNGPLREPIKRISQADLLLINHFSQEDFDSKFSDSYIKKNLHLPQSFPVHHVKMMATIFYSLAQKDLQVKADYFLNKQITALCAIANPKRFFNTLNQLGIYSLHELSFPDHHQYSLKDLSKNDEIIITTEKDAIKLKDFRHKEIWVLMIQPIFQNSLEETILSFLEKRHQYKGNTNE